MEIEVKKTNKKTQLPVSRMCYVCGEQNPTGLRAKFHVEDGLVKTHWQPKPHHCGLENVLHGGVTAALLDECMAWAATRAFGRFCVTGDMSIRYTKRVPTDRRLTVCARVVKPGRKLAHVQGTLLDDDGTEYATAQARFVAISTEETLDAETQLIYRDDDERLFDTLRAESSRTAGDR